MKERVWADDQKVTDFDGEGKTRIEFSSTQILSAMEWIFAQGANAVPRSPAWFVESWKNSVRAMMERANPSDADAQPAPIARFISPKLTGAYEMRSTLAQKLCPLESL